MNPYILSLFIFGLGAAVGSFVNVVALRFNTGLSFIKGDSRCLSCNKKIASSNLIPIFSFINLKGRCAACKAKLSLSYFLIEVGSGVLSIMLYLKFGLLSSSFIVSFLIFELLLLIFIYDFRHKIIPDSFVFWFIALSFVYSYFILNFSLFSIILGGILVPLPFFLIWLFSGGRLLGFGDIKFMIGIGFLFGITLGFSAVVFSFWLGALGIILLYGLNSLRKHFHLSKVTKNLTMKSEIPFAPFLVLATFLQFFFQFNLF